jgi:hypothetical protein
MASWRRGSSWAEVSFWLSIAGLGRIDAAAAETAGGALEVDALLRARKVLRDAPTAQRQAMAKLVDA